MVKTEKQAKQNMRSVIERKSKVLIENYFETERGKYRFRIVSYNGGIYMFKDLKKPDEEDYKLVEFKDISKMAKEV